MEQLRVSVLRYRAFVVLALISCTLAVEVATVVPAIRRTSRAGEELLSVRTQIESIRSQAGEMDEMRSSGVELTAPARAISASELVPALLEEIASFGKKHAVEIYTVLPDGEPEVMTAASQNGEQVTYTCQKIWIRGTASYTAMGEFLRELEQGPLTIVVERIEIRKTLEGGARLDAGLLVSAFAKGQA
ncbi:MAG: hypothetical protein V2A71_04305 [Candidatus Eisenbacteria bacterium]